MDDETDWVGRILAGLLVSTFLAMGGMAVWNSRHWTSYVFCALVCGIGCGIVHWIMREPAPLNDEDPPD